MKNKKILVLGATVNQLPFILLAKEYGHSSISMDNVPENICHQYADEHVNISTIDKDLVLEYAQKNRIDAVITCASDLALPTAAYVAKEMKLPFISPEAVATTVDKKDFHLFLLKHGFNVPKHYVFENIKEALETTAKLSGKWIVKPTDSSGSKGVYFLNFNEKIPNLKEILIKTRSFSQSKKILIEEYIDGDHCSVDGFFNNGKIDKIIITNKLLTPLPYRTPIGHTLPSKLPTEIQKRIKNTVKKIIEQLGVSCSPFDFDVVVDAEGKIFILEMSLRIGGNGIPKLIKHAEQYNLYESALLQVLGEKISSPKKSSLKLFTGVFLIFSDQEGYLKNINSQEDIQKKYGDSLKEITYDVSEGDKVEKFVSGNHRLGHFILQCNSDEQLMSLAVKIKKDLSIKISPNKND